MINIFVLYLLLVSCRIISVDIFDRIKKEVDPIEYKLKSSIEVQNVEGAKEAINSGADINRFHDRRLWEHTNHAVLESNPVRIAMAAGCFEVAKVLLESGADSNYEDSTGVSLLQAAAEFNNEFIYILMDNGADINKVCKNGNTALEYAIKKQEWESAEILLEFSPKIRDETFSAFVYVYENGLDAKKFSFKILRRILKIIQTNQLDNVFIEAILGNDEKVIQYLNGESDMLVLEAVAAFCKPETLSLVIKLIDECNFSTIYAIAALYGNTDNLIWISDFSSNVEMLNEDKSSESAPIQLAAQYDYFETVKYLYSVNSENNTALMGMRILDAAAKNNNLNMASFIINESWDFSYKYAAEIAIKNKNSEILDLLLTEGLNPNDEVQSDCLLEIACFYNDLESVKLLVENGADIDGQHNGEPLSLAARRGNIEIVEYLIQNGANLNGNNMYDDGSGGMSVLMYAVIGGQFDCVKILVENGADIFYKYEGTDAVAWAKNEESESIYIYLQSESEKKALT